MNDVPETENVTSYPILGHLLKTFSAKLLPEAGSRPQGHLLSKVTIKL